MWKTNLAICITIVLLVDGYFFYQVQAASQQFRNNSSEHSRVLAAAVELNIRNAMRSTEGLELIISDFLRNSAHFIAYLDVIERFTAAELAAFAREVGLAGITIVAEDGRSRVTGPAGWGPQLGCDAEGELIRHRDKQLYSLVYTGSGEQAGNPSPGCVIVGFSSLAVDEVQQEISVQTLLDHLDRLPGIASVRLLAADPGMEPVVGGPARLVTRDGRHYSETRLPLGDQMLVVTQQADHFARRLAQMRAEFLLFLLFLALFGALSSWWLYHGERLRLAETREYEQQMARQHEAATLGRAAATIAHEIRNPLNAIGIGLQRLQLEATTLEREHLALLSAMREALSRSNAIVTSLQHYVQELVVSPEPVDLLACITGVLQLYQTSCAEQGIAVVLDGKGDYTAAGSYRLLGQLLENIVKNAVEAQPQGGFCHILLGGDPAWVKVEVSSGGFFLTAEASDNLFAPYFTTKTQGTGLGLAISRKIVEAHGGTVVAKPDTRAKTLTLTVVLPRWQTADTGEPPSLPPGGLV
ncbi:MAG: sensor histidine kinase [Desulfopila sp.]